MRGLTTIVLKVPRYKVFNETANNANNGHNLPFFQNSEQTESYSGERNNSGKLYILGRFGTFEFSREY